MAVESGENLIVEGDGEAKRLASRWIGLVLDLAVGFWALVVFGIVLVVFHSIALRVFVSLGGLLFFVAAMTRAIWSKLNPWMEGIAISLGAFFPVALVAVIAFHGGNLRLWGCAIVLAVICGAGAQTQKFWSAGHRLAGAGTVAALLVVLAVVGRFAGPLIPSLGHRAMDQPAPQFTMTMLDGTPVTLASLEGRVVVLDFWGTWCEPCMAEMPTILKVHRQYQVNGNVVFLAVNPGWHDDTPEKIRDVVGKKHMDVPVALASFGTAKSFAIEGLPTLIVIDRKGHIRMEDVGYDEDEPLESELTGQIEGLLGH
jgi:thiol-disulfide isomerase/thioredoxin